MTCVIPIYCTHFGRPESPFEGISNIDQSFKSHGEVVPYLVCGVVYCLTEVSLHSVLIYYSSVYILCVEWCIV